MEILHVNLAMQQRQLYNQNLKFINLKVILLNLSTLKVKNFFFCISVNFFLPVLQKHL